MDEEAEEKEDWEQRKWLQRIPDDPGELLRRKFKYQYNQRQHRNTRDKSW